MKTSSEDVTLRQFPLFVRASEENVGGHGILADRVSSIGGHRSSFENQFDEYIFRNPLITS